MKSRTSKAKAFWDWFEQTERHYEPHQAESMTSLLRSVQVCLNQYFPGIVIEILPAPNADHPHGLVFSCNCRQSLSMTVREIVNASPKFEHYYAIPFKTPLENAADLCYRGVRLAKYKASIIRHDSTGKVLIEIYPDQWPLEKSSQQAIETLLQLLLGEELMIECVQDIVIAPEDEMRPGHFAITELPARIVQVICGDQKKH